MVRGSNSRHWQILASHSWTTRKVDHTKTVKEMSLEVSQKVQVEFTVREVLRDELGRTRKEK